jgi:hypothetical protein
MTQLKPYSKVEDGCAQDLTSRRISVAVKGKTDTDVPRMYEYERVIPSRNAISTMKGNSLPSPGGGQIAKGGGAVPIPVAPAMSAASQATCPLPNHGRPGGTTQTQPDPSV